MALNGSELINNPWNVTWSPWTNLFRDMMGSGGVFWLVPLIALTFGIYIKTNGNTTMATAFMVGSGALLSGGSIFTGNTGMSLVFIIFTAIGLTGLFTSVLFQRGGN